MNLSTMSGYTPDIPLREPLEFEYRLNRKMAKKIYQREKEERVLMNKERNSMEKAMKMQTLINEYSEKEKKFLKDRLEAEETRA